jgi:hypothetical protein
MYVGQLALLMQLFVYLDRIVETKKEHEILSW